MKILDIVKNKETTQFLLELPAKDWKKCQEDALKSLCQSVSVPGFRKGHVPKEMVEARVGKQEIIGKAINKGVDLLYKDLVDHEKFTKEELIEDTPKIEVKKANDNVLEVSFSFENFPTVTVPNCEKIKINLKQNTVSDQDVEREVQNIVKKDTMLVVKESDAIEMNDYAFFDFKGSVDGKYFPGGEAKNYQLEIGSGNFIPGFEDQMIGLKRGEEKEIKVVFPDTYHEKSLAGKEAKFEIKINEIKAAKKPTIDDAFIKGLNLPEVNCLADLEKFIRTHLEKRVEQKNKTEATKIVAQYIVENSKVDFFPKTLVDSEKKRMFQELEKNAQESKIPFEQYVRNALGIMSQDDFEPTLEENAKKNLTLILALNSLIKKYDVKVDGKEIDDYLGKIASAYQTDLETLKKQIGGQIEQIEIQLIQEKMFDKLIKINQK